MPVLKQKNGYMELNVPVPITRSNDTITYNYMNLYIKLNVPVYKTKCTGI